MQISWESNTDLIIHQFLLLSSFSLPTFPFKIINFHLFYHLASVHSLLTHPYSLYLIFLPVCSFPPPSRSYFPPIPPLFPPSSFTPSPSATSFGLLFPYPSSLYPLLPHPTFLYLLSPFSFCPIPFSLDFSPSILMFSVYKSKFTSSHNLKKSLFCLVNLKYSARRGREGEYSTILAGSCCRNHQRLIKQTYKHSHNF